MGACFLFIVLGLLRFAEYKNGFWKVHALVNSPKKTGKPAGKSRGLS